MRTLPTSPYLHTHVRYWPMLDAVIELDIEGFTFGNERMLAKTTEGGKANLPTSPYLNTNAGRHTSHIARMWRTRLYEREFTVEPRVLQR